MSKNLRLALVLFLFKASSIYANEGNLSITSDVKGAYIYVDDKKKAMTEDEFTSILLEEGEHTIKVTKPIDKYMGYVAEEKVFVEENVSTEINFKLKLDATAVEKIWDKTFGGKKRDEASSIIQSQDGGFVVAGYTESKSVGEGDFWIIKIDKNGNKIWDKTFGGKEWDGAKSIIQSKDGGFITVGWTYSKGAGDRDIWIIKIDKDGNKIWDKTFGGKKREEVYSIKQTKDGGYIVAGCTYSKGAGDRDMWIIKIDEDGKKIWDKTFGGKERDAVYSIIQTKDGGFILAGSTHSKGAGDRDVWIVKIDKNGNKIWDKTLGGKKSDEA